MDFAGRDLGKLRYPVDRPLSDEELAAHYDQKTVGEAPPMDFLSVIRFNSTYVDLVDRWYPITGFSVWFGFSIAFCGLLFAGVSGTAFLWAPESSDRSALWF